jgi:hypothetical protein
MTAVTVLPLQPVGTGLGREASRVKQDRLELLTALISGPRFDPLLRPETKLGSCPRVRQRPGGAGTWGVPGMVKGLPLVAGLRQAGLLAGRATTLSALVV